MRHYSTFIMDPHEFYMKGMRAGACDDKFMAVLNTSDLGNTLRCLELDQGAVFSMGLGGVKEKDVTV